MSPQDLQRPGGPDEDGRSPSGFLTSPGNLVGLSAFLAVFVTVLLISESLQAAVIAALLGYGAGYFMAPAPRPPRQVRSYGSGVPVEGATQAQMHQRLDDVTTEVRNAQRRLPPAARDELHRALGQLREMAQRWDTVVAAPEHRHVLELITYDYLPNTLHVFLRIPDSEKPHHAAEWTRQLEILTSGIERSRTAVLRRDLEAMRTQGRLLEQRFEDGDLTRFREHGL